MEQKNYKEKYLKYKIKYLKLKNFFIQKGGSGKTIIPYTNPPTYSYLYMPLIFYSIDNSSVTLPQGFEQLVNNILDTGKDIFLNPESSIGFQPTLAWFSNYLKDILNRKGFLTTCDISKFRDKPSNQYHISGAKQMEIIDYNTNLIIGYVIEAINERLITTPLNQDVKKALSEKKDSKGNPIIYIARPELEKILASKNFSIDLVSGFAGKEFVYNF